MAKAVFHSNRGEKSALILLKANKFVFGKTPVYVPRLAVEGLAEGEELDIPDGYKLADIIGEDGEIRTTKDGVPLKQLVY